MNWNFTLIKCFNVYEMMRLASDKRQ